mmetsp:Transcript_2615/g.5852  ORF Transcript_2615/g.5852 Transcript_2615/m.5852 type:complete len:84 (+) Transcript_2615:1321-1572(+)
MTDFLIVWEAVTPVRVFPAPQGRTMIPDRARPLPNIYTCKRCFALGWALDYTEGEMPAKCKHTHRISSRRRILSDSDLSESRA